MSDIVKQSIAHFTDQFEDSTDLQNLAHALLTPGEYIEETLNDMLLLRWVDTAYGEQLDLLGQAVGIQRRGREDASFRPAIKFQIFINTSKAQPEDVIKAAKVLSRGDFVRYWENYPAGLQVFTDGPNVLDASGSVIQQYDLTTDSDGALQLSDGIPLTLRYADQPPEALVMFLKDVAPAGIDFITLTFSLGINPLFGFGSDFLSRTLAMENEEDFHTNDGGLLDVYAGEIAPSTDGFQGFSEMVFQSLATDDTGDFYISSNIVDPSQVPLYVEGKLIDEEGPLELRNVVFEQGDLTLQGISMKQAYVKTYPRGELVTQGIELLLLALENRDLFELDNGGNLFITNIYDLIILLSDDGGELTLDNGGNILVRVNEEIRIFPFHHEDQTRMPLNIEGEPLIDPLITSDGNNFMITDGKEVETFTFSLEDAEPLLMNQEALVETLSNLATNDSSAIMLQDGSMLEVQTISLLPETVNLSEGFSLTTDDGSALQIMAFERVMEYSDFALEDNALFGLREISHEPAEGLLTLDDGTELEMEFFDVLDDPSTLLIFDQNQVPEDGGKFAEGMVDR